MSELELERLSGEDVADMEEAVLRQLSDTPEACVVATCGGEAAAARGERGARSARAHVPENACRVSYHRAPRCRALRPPAAWP